MRSLIHIPIIHTQADMGALAGAIRRLSIEKIGRREWERSIRAIDRLWTIIRGTIEKLDLPYPRVRLYQDGLPNCGREVQIVSDLAKAGSPNHQLLSAQGLGEVERVQARQESLSQSLLERRDRYIAERMNGTLGEAETGILFLGMLHSLEKHLAKDITVHYPILRPQHPKQRKDPCGTNRFA